MKRKQHITLFARIARRQQQQRTTPAVDRSYQCVPFFSLFFPSFPFRLLLLLSVRMRFVRPKTKQNNSMRMVRKS